MEINTQIKKYRMSIGWTQDEMAEKIFVTRQTISNWENGKSYPDIHSLLLLSSLFNVSLDQLIKGDIHIMREEINEVEVKKLDRYGAIYTILLSITILSAVPLFMWLGFYAYIPWGMIFATSMFFALKVESVKKVNNIQTYKEILAFTEGKRLDEIEKQREIGKRPYQKILLVLGSAAIALAGCLLVGVLMHIFLS